MWFGNTKTAWWAPPHQSSSGGGDGATVLQGLPEAGRVMLQVQALQGVQSERVDLWRWHRAVGSLPGGIPMSSEEALIHENAGGHWISRQEL